jgi:hypothetical protein
VRPTRRNRVSDPGAMEYNHTAPAKERWQSPCANPGVTISARDFKNTSGQEVLLQEHTSYCSAWCYDTGIEELSEHHGLERGESLQPVRRRPVTIRARLVGTIPEERTGCRPHKFSAWENGQRLEPGCSPAKRQVTPFHHPSQGVSQWLFPDSLRWFTIPGARVRRFWDSRGRLQRLGSRNRDSEKIAHLVLLEACKSGPRVMNAQEGQCLGMLPHRRGPPATAALDRGHQEP